MPDNVPIAAFVFGSVLILLALVGGSFKMFGAEFSGTAGRPARIIAGILGMFLIYIGIVKPVSSDIDNKSGDQSSERSPILRDSTTTSNSPSQTKNDSEKNDEEINHNPTELSNSSVTKKQTESIIVPENLAGTWVGNVKLLEEGGLVLCTVRLVVDSKGKIDIYKSDVRYPENLVEPPRTIINGRLSKVNGLHFEFNNPTGNIGVVNGDKLEFLSNDLITVEGMMSSYKGKEDMSLAELLIPPTPALINLERQH